MSEEIINVKQIREGFPNLKDAPLKYRTDEQREMILTKWEKHRKQGKGKYTFLECDYRTLYNNMNAWIKSLVEDGKEEIAMTIIDRLEKAERTDKAHWENLFDKVAKGEKVKKVITNSDGSTDTIETGGNPAMLIFAAKNKLGMTDKIENTNKEISINWHEEDTLENPNKIIEEKLQ